MPPFRPVDGFVPTRRARNDRVARIGRFWHRANLSLNLLDDRSIPSATAVADSLAVLSPNAPFIVANSVRRELVIVDPRVPDYQAIIGDIQNNQSLSRRIEIAVLRADTDGIDQIARLLRNERGLSAIHFISHGNSGGVQLGSNWLNAETLAQRGDQVATWSKSLTPGADLLFYGCDLASGTKGRQLLRGIRGLTGADVSASTDRTGATRLGGNWQLEYAAGRIESSLAVSAVFQQTYIGTLATFVVTSTADSGAGSLRTAITQANSTVGIDTITFNIKGAGVQTISLGSALPNITDAVVIDGTTQAGFKGTPLIELDGNGAGGAANGLTITGGGTTIRGLIINRFGNDGILISGGGSNIIAGNYLGISSNGKNARANARDGLEVLSSGNTIGGATAADRNVISSNGRYGVEINGSGGNNNAVLGNYIGTDTTGANPLGNVSHGIYLDNGASNNVIGGTVAGAGNTIAYSGGDGIRLIGASTAGNQFYGNSIHDNAGLGIDLDGNGPTPNDFQDPDSGANADKNFPIITSAQVVGGQVTIVGSYNGITLTNYRLEFFVSSVADPSGYGEGERFLGFANVTTDGNGDATFSVTLTATVAAGEVVAGTAIDLFNLNSSEFSPVVVVTTPGIVVLPSSGLITTESGGKASFTVVLTSKPAATVTIPLSVSNPAEGKLSVVSLTFTQANWNTAQTVTITGVDDSVADDDQPYTIILGAATSADPLYNGLDAPDVSAVNLDNEVAGIFVTPVSGLVTTEAGGTASFTVVLTSQPVSVVTIPVSVSNSLEAKLSVTSLTFTPADWNSPQTVIVTGVNDFTVDGNQPYTIILGAAISPGNPYDGVDATDVSAINFDDDTASFKVTPTSGLITTEAGGKATFTVVLTSQPTSPVTIGVNTSNPAEGAVSLSSLMFDATNWNTPQTITITGVDDFVDDGDQLYTIVLGAAASADPIYNGMNLTDVGVTNTDNDTAGIIVTPTSGLITTEAGSKATFTVVLTSQPTSPVTISVNSSNPGEGTVGVPSLTFNAGNWNTPQTITITGVDDFVVDGNQPYAIVLGAATSADAIYSGMNPTDVSVTNTDDDTAGIIVTPTSGLTTTEVGGKATFTVVLTSQPVSLVTISVNTSNPAEGTVSVPSLTFNAGNWNTPQTITITGVDDFVMDGNQPYTIVFGAATSADAIYNGTNPTDVSITNTDDDIGGIIVTPTSGLITTEAGSKTTFTVVLTSQPVSPVTISVGTSNPAEGTANVSLLTFNAGNWNTPQTITITGVGDFVVDGNQPFTIVLGAATSVDAIYNGIDPADVSVTNMDNVVAGIIVTPITGLNTTEAGGTAVFAVVLTSQPVGTVTINLNSNDVAEGMISANVLTFDAGNWNLPQTVTVTGVDDFIADGNQAYSIVLAAATSADANYNGVNPNDVSCTNADNDTAGIVVTPTSGLTTSESGGTAVFTVVLTSQPTAAVTIGVISSTVGEGTISISSLTFDASNWNIAQSVTITGVDDSFADGDVMFTVVTNAATSADMSYAGQDPADVVVTNRNNDTAGLNVVIVGSLVVNNAGQTATVMVSLTSQPYGPVTVQIISSNTGALAAEPIFVTFIGPDWATGVPVTLKGVNSNRSLGDLVVSVDFVASSSDAGYAGQRVNKNAISRILSTNTIKPPYLPAPPYGSAGDDLGNPENPSSIPGNDGPGGRGPSAQRLPDGGGGGEASEFVPAVKTVARPPVVEIASTESVLVDRSAPIPTSELITAYKPVMVVDSGTHFVVHRNQMDRVDDEITHEKTARASTARMALGSVVIVSAGCVLWSLRGAAWLLSAVASAAPSWTVLDPMVLLLARQKRRDDEDETLADLAKAANKI